MSAYGPGRYGLHELAVVALAAAEARQRFFLPGLSPVAGPPDVVWDDAPGSGRPLAGDPRDPDPPRSFVAVDSAGRWHLAGPDHDGRLPVQDVLLRRGATLLHGTAVAVAGRGVLVLGPPGSGKTVVAVAVLAQPGWRLVADDVVVATAAGELLATEAPLAIYPEHIAVLPPGTGVRPGAKRAWRAVRDTPLIGPAARTVKRWAGRRGGRLGGRVRRFEARYRSVAPAELFPPERRAAGAPLAAVLVLDPAAKPWALTEAGSQRSAAVLVAEAYADGGMHDQLARYGRAGVVDVAAHWGAAAEVLNAVAGVASRHAALGVPRRAQPAELLRRGRGAITELLA